jgi:uncharacterized protein YceH (UPF0502 family)
VGGGAAAAPPRAETAPSEPGDDVKARLKRLEDDVASLRQEVESLRAP